METLHLNKPTPQTQKPEGKGSPVIGEASHLSHWVRGLPGFAQSAGYNASVTPVRACVLCQGTLILEGPRGEPLEGGIVVGRGFRR